MINYYKLTQQGITRNYFNDGVVWIVHRELDLAIDPIVDRFNQKAFFTFLLLTVPDRVWHETLLSYAITTCILTILNSSSDET